MKRSFVGIHHFPCCFPERKARNQEGVLKGKGRRKVDRREERRASVLESDQWSFEEHLRVRTKDRDFEWENTKGFLAFSEKLTTVLAPVTAVSKTRTNFQGMPGRGRGKTAQETQARTRPNCSDVRHNRPHFIDQKANQTRVAAEPTEVMFVTNLI